MKKAIGVVARLLAVVPVLTLAAPLKDPRLSSEHDDMLDITWYSAANASSVLDGAQWTSVGVYFGWFGKKKSFGPLRLKAVYHSDDWVFAEGLLIKLDDESPFAIAMPHPRRDAGSGGIWEYLDVGLNPRDLAKVCSAKMMKAKAVKVRFVGREMHDDFELPDNQVDGIRMVCSAYADRNHPERGQALAKKAEAEERAKAAEVEAQQAKFEALRLCIQNASEFRKPGSAYDVTDIHKMCEANNSDPAPVIDVLKADTSTMR